MADMTHAATLLPARISGLEDFERFKERAYESHASYEQFLQEVLQAEEDAAQSGVAEPTAAQVIGAGLMLAGRYEEAGRWLDQAPADSLTLYLRGYCERSARSFDKAIRRPRPVRPGSFANWRLSKRIWTPAGWIWPGRCWRRRRPATPISP